MTDTLRADLEAAFKEAEEAAEAVIEATPPPEPQEAAPEPPESTIDEPPADPPPQEEKPSQERQRDEKGRFVAVESHPDDAQAYPTLTEDRLALAPEGWRPGEREGWNELPPHIQRAIHRRELDIATGMEQASEARTTADRFTKLVTPYRAIMDAHGAPGPFEAVEGLLKSVAVLHQGTPEQKAGKVLELMRSYQITPDQLADALEQAPSLPESPPGAPASPSPLEQRLAALEQRMQGPSPDTMAQADQQIAEFAPRAEFLKDVRPLMADLLETASARGIRMSLEDAYDTACRMHPEIRDVIAQRATQQTMQQEQERKRATAAATSLGPANGIEAPKSTPNSSLRDDLLAAWDLHQNQ